jgi:hypothetical protein
MLRITSLKTKIDLAERAFKKLLKRKITDGI